MHEAILWHRGSSNRQNQHAQPLLLKASREGLQNPNSRRVNKGDTSCGIFSAGGGGGTAVEDAWSRLAFEAAAAATATEVTAAAISTMTTADTGDMLSGLESEKRRWGLRTMAVAPL